MNRLVKVLILIASVICTNRGFSQVIIPGGFAREYYDLLLFQDTSLNKPINQFPSIVRELGREKQESWNLWSQSYPFSLVGSVKVKDSYMEIVNPIVRVNYTTNAPRSYNDGAQWNGRGANLFLSGGIRGRVGKLHFAFVPNVQLSENREFEIPETPSGRSEFAYPFDSRIDWVQRYGDDNYVNFDFGQSEIRIIHNNLSVGLSTENFRWGVTQFSPILMSYNAPGFPHLDIGTNLPVETKIGRIEGRAFWGILVESGFFDLNPTNETGYITGFNIGYSPSFFPELSIGINRVMNTRWSDGELSERDFFAMLIQNTHNDFEKNDDYDQMMSLTMDLAFKEVGFRTYLEFARNDFPGNFNEFIENPDRSRAFTLGLMKTFKVSQNLLQVVFESTTLSKNQLQRLNTGNPTYYVHPWSVRGYTNKGQIIGAGIGPGGNNNFFLVNYFFPKGKWGLNMSRIRFNDDYLVSAFDGKRQFPTDFEFTIGVDHVRHFDRFTLNPMITWIFRKNWYFQDDVKVNAFQVGMNFSYKF